MEPAPRTIRPDELLAELGWLRELAGGLVRDAALAEDLVQDTWIAATTRPPRELGEGGLRGWLSAVVRNLARREARSSSRRGRRERAVARPEAQRDGVVARGALQLELVQAVMELEEPLRSAVLLRYLDGLSAVQIAERQGLSHAAARKRLSRALAVLRERLDRRHGGDREQWFLAMNAWLEVGADGALAVPASKVMLTGTLVVIAKVGAALAAAVLLWLGWSYFDSLPREGASGALGEPVAVTPADASAPAGDAVSIRRSEPLGGVQRELRWTLVDEHGRPLEGWTALALDGGAWRATSTSDAAGALGFDETMRIDTLVVARVGARPARFDGLAGSKASPLVVPAGASVSGVIESRERDGVVRLTLEDDLGDDLFARLDSRALAELERLGIQPLRRTLALDEAGRFRFDGLPAHWTGVLELQGGWSFETATAPAVIDPPQLALLLAPATDLRFTASPPLRVHGRVVHPGRSDGIEGVHVTAQRAGFAAELVHTSRTGLDGHFTLEIPRRGLQREAWKALLRLECAGVVQRSTVLVDAARLERERELGTFELELGRRVRVQVRSTAGAPVAGAWVRAGMAASGTTSRDGSVELALSGEGEGLLQVSADGHRPTEVEAPSGGEILVLLEPSNRLDVRVVDERGRAWSHGRVRLACAQSPFASRTGLVGPLDLELELDGQGELVLSDLTPGLELELTCAGAPEVLRRVRAPAAGAAERIELVRASPPAALLGRVVDADGRPLPRCTVTASSHDSVELVTDAEGRFEARLDSSWRSVDLLEVSRAGFARSELADLRLPLAAPLEIVLEVGHELEALVLDAQGSPLDLPFLRVQVDDGREFDAELLGDGRHRFAGLPMRAGSIVAQACGVEETRPFDARESLVTLRLPAMAELELNLAPAAARGATLTCAVIRPLAGPAPLRRMYFREERDQFAPLLMPIAAGRYSLEIERRELGKGGKVELLAPAREFDIGPGTRVVLVVP